MGGVGIAAAKRPFLGMEAACVSLALLLGWSAIGYGPSAILAGHRPPVVRILLAPAVGLALVTVPTFWINRLGLPVQTFAAVLAGALLVVSIAATLCAQKTNAALRRADLAPAALLVVLIVAAMALVGWPGLRYGLDWLGYANDDMANYALSAARLRAHGYFEMPELKVVLDNSDMSQFYWHLNQVTRYGGDLVVALISSLWGKSEAALFMPAMVALHASLVGAAAALVAAERQTLGTVAVAVIIVAINPLVTFSTYSQLLAQIGGLALSCAFLSVLVEPWKNSVQTTIKTAFLAGLLLFALWIWYIEVIVLPLAGLSLYFVINGRMFISSWKRLLPAMIAVFAAIVLLSGSYLQLAIRYFIYQAGKGGDVVASDAIVFNYFLIKTGLLSFWGLVPITGDGLNNVPITLFLLGIVLFNLAALGLIVALRQRSLLACMTVILSALAVIMLYKRADFALFKSVLWLQPLLASLLAAQLMRFLNRQDSGFFDQQRSFTYLGSLINSRRGIASLMLVTIGIITGAAQLRTLFFYARIAADEPSTALFNQLPSGSRLGLLHHLASVPRVQPGNAYVIDSDNTVLTKLIALHTIGTPLRVMSFNPFKIDSFLAYFSQHFPARASERGEDNTEISFEWPSSHEHDVLRLRRQFMENPKPNDVLIAATGENSVLNRFQFGYPQTEPVIPRLIKNVFNHLSFLPTALKSRHYFDYDIPADKFSEYRGQIALWTNEPDYFFPGRTMVGAGRRLMLRAINPTPNARLMLELTASLKADGNNRLPPVQVIGESAALLGTIGRGSARLYSRPLMPWRLGDASVVGIDMGVDGRRFTDQDGNPTRDIRRLTSFVRDISLVAERDYEALQPPSEVRSFPQGLADKALEYSGLYEDGWMAESAFLRLAGPKQTAQFRVSGQVRGDVQGAAPTELVVRVDGVEKAREGLKPGPFTIAFQLAPSERPIRVELEASAAAALSAADRRPASVQLSSVGWRSDAHNYLSAFRPASHQSDVASALGFWADGWAATRAQLTLSGGAAGRLAIRGMAPKIEQPFTTKLVVAVDGKPIGTLDIEPGDVVADLPLAASDRPRRITLEFGEGQNSAVARLASCEHASSRDRDQVTRLLPRRASEHPLNPHGFTRALSMLAHLTSTLPQLAFVSGAVLGGWILFVLLGLPFTLACLPRARRWLALPLSPVVAVALIASIHQHLFFSFLQPYRPFAAYGVVVAISLAALGLALLLSPDQFVTLRSDAACALVRVRPYLVVPLLAAVAFGAFFATNGLEMLSAGQDELGYVETARHIAGHMFTRDAQDLPWGRHDHYLAEAASRSIAYVPGLRLGGYFLLADLSFVFGLSLEQAFPILVGVGLVTATASIALVALLLRRPALPLIAAQIAFATSWLLVMLHFQGSLSHVLSLSFRLGGLAYILWALAFAGTFKALAPAVALGAGWLLVYNESIGFGLALPVGVALAAAVLRAVRGRAALLGRFAPRMLVCVGLISALQWQLLGFTISAHLTQAGANLGNLAGTGVDAILKRGTTLMGNVLPPILGYHSLYDQTLINLQLAQLLGPYSAVLLAGLAAAAALGYWLRLPAGPREGWSVLPLALAAVAIAAAMQENALLVIRFAQMACPHVFLGLSILAFGRRSALLGSTGAAARRLRAGSAGRAATAGLWAIVVALNSFALARTVDFVNRHSQSTDPTVRHFNPDTEVWQRLRELVAQSGGDPVLFSGFTNTPIPHMIALGLRDIPHVVGTTITAFWQTIDPAMIYPRDARHLAEYFDGRRHWLSTAELTEHLKADPVWDWPTTYERLLARSRFAIVPNSGAYPPEWGGPRRLFGAKAWRFPNLCDVIERDSTAFLFDTEQASAGRDELGPYWQTNGAVEARPQLSAAELVILEVHYTGPAPRLSIDGVAANGEVRLEPASRSSVLMARARLDSGSLIMVSTEPQTRLRSIMLYRLPAERLQDVQRTDSDTSEPQAPQNPP